MERCYGGRRSRKAMSNPAVNIASVVSAQTAQFISNLCARWLDTKTYLNQDVGRHVNTGDFAAFEDAVRDRLRAHGAHMTRLHRRPFGPEFVVNGERFVMKCDPRTFKVKLVHLSRRTA